MNCCVCGRPATERESAVEYATIDCSQCGTFKVSRALLRGVGEEDVPLEARVATLDRARKHALAGQPPTITEWSETAALPIESRVKRMGG